MNRRDEAEDDVTHFFDNLESELVRRVPSHYFDRPRRFRSLLEVIDVLGSKIESADNEAGENIEDPILSLEKQNPAYNNLVSQREFIAESIEKVVKFQHGSLNHGVETMGDVLGAYTKSKAEVGTLRQSISEIKDVLLSKKDEQTDFKNLWLRKVELEESLRMLNNIERLKDAPMLVQLHTQHNRYLAAVNMLNQSVKMMFEVDYVSIDALSSVREQLMNQKEVLLEMIAEKLKGVVVGANNELWNVKKSLKSKHGGIVRAGSTLGSALGSVRGGASRRAGSIDDDRSQFESEIGYSEVGRSVFNGRSPPPSELGSINGASDSASASVRTPVRGGAVRRTSGPGQNASFSWSTDMSEATEEKEASLVDPQESGSLFIRLLVKGVSMLQCEDDMERMIFEGTHEQFRGMLRKMKSQRLREAEELRSDSNNILKEAERDRQNIVIFTLFVQDMLNAALLMLKMVFYVLKLIDQCKRMRYSNAGMELQTANKATELKESAIKEVLLLWTTTENIIVGELQRHFVEKDVEETEDEESTSLLSRRSSGNFFGFKFQEVDPEGLLDEDKLTVCPPSCRLAAPVYKDIVSFSTKVNALLSEEIDGNMGMPDIIEKAVQRTLDNSLMPLIQLEVNTEMQELQTDNSLFTTRSVHSDPSYVDSTDNTGQLKICEAAKRCARVINPLFYHWNELPQHQDMVLTILDRVVRGFISAAKEEVEQMSWKFASAEKTHHKAILDGIRKDPLLTSYRQDIFDGKVSIDELLDTRGSASSSTTATHLSPSRSSSTLQQHAKTGGEEALEKEFNTWGEIWDIQNTHAALGEKVVNDFSKFNALSSISYGCDWLIRVICNCFTQTMMQSLPHRSHRHRAPSKSSDEPGSLLYSTIHSLSSALMSLSEMCLALIRGEIEVACLHFLRQLILHHVRGSSSSQQKDQVSKASSTSKGSSTLQEGDNNIVSVFNHHLISCQDAILTAASPGLLSVVLSPLCKIIPIFFTKSLVFHIPKEFFSMPNLDRLLKSIIACQQNFSILLESSSFEPVVSRRMQDCLSDEFDRVRSLMNLINMNPSDFKDFAKSHRQEFTKDEYEFAWNFLRHRNLTSRLPAFAELWKEVCSPTAGSSSLDQGEDLPPVPAMERIVSGRRSSMKSRRSSGF